MKSYIKQGDCLELMKDIPNESIDMILCDLPYGVTRCEWDIKIPWEPLWQSYERIIKPNGAICLFSQMPFTAELVQSNRKLYRYEWIYEKTSPVGFLNANRMPMKSHESIQVFYKHLPIYNPQMTTGKQHRRGGNARASDCYGDFGLLPEQKSTEYYPTDIIRFSNGNRMHGHNTAKPVDLLSYLIRTYTNPGDIVLDNCMGSGSTCVAAIQTGRRYIGMELNSDFFGTAKKRIVQAEAENEREE